MTITAAPPQRTKIRQRRRLQQHRQQMSTSAIDSLSATTSGTLPTTSWILLLVISLLAIFPRPTTCTSPNPLKFTTSVDSTNLFRGIADDSPLARTMSGGQRGAWGGDPYSVAAPGAEPLQLSHGTTTVALVCKGGVIAAVDSRASMGSFVGSRTTQKVIPVTDHILGTMAGGAADCTFWLRYLSMQAKIFERRNGFPMPVATAARVLADTLLGQRGRRLSVGTMVMGYDRGRGGGGDGREGQLFYVDSEGARVKGRYFSVGSGSTYAYSVLDEGYRPDMSLQEAAVLARRAVRHATFRDAFSGGFINVFLVNASGWSRVGVDDAGFLEFRPADKIEGGDNADAVGYETPGGEGVLKRGSRGDGEAQEGINPEGAARDNR